MRVFVVFAHPSRMSFTHRVYAAFCEEVRATGHDIVTSELYQMGWVSDMSESEYLRESSQSLALPVPGDVLCEQEKWNSAQMIAFIYPVWWTDVPAKLKGWFDRVFTYGFAYREDGRPVAQKVLEKALVLCASGHPADHLREVGLLPSMEKVMLTDRIAARAKEARFELLGGQGENGEAYKEAQIQKARVIAQDFIK